MDYNLLEKPYKFTTKNININNSEYYVPYNYIVNNETNNIILNSSKQSYMMKIINVDNKDYYVPHHWIDCEYTKNIIRKSLEKV